MFDIAGIMYAKPILPIGTKIKFRGEKQRYTVRASNAAYTIATKPFNAQKTVLYTIIDFHEKIRGPENLIFSLGAETDREILFMMDRLTYGDSEVSGRNRISLNIESIETPKDKEHSVDDAMYCTKCGGCGYIGCDGIAEFLTRHVKNNTDCLNEDTFIHEIIGYIEGDDNEKDTNVV